MADDLTGIFSPGGEIVSTTSKLDVIGEDKFGIIMGESTTNPSLKDAKGNPRWTDPRLMPRLIAHEAKIKGQDITIHYHVRIRPGVLDPEIYYPSKIIVMSQNVYELADNIPQDSWKLYPLIDENNSPVSIGGVTPMVYYYTQVNVQPIDDEEKEFSAIPGPFIKGSDIIQRQEDKNRSISLLGVGNQSIATGGVDSLTRMRVEDDESVHIIA